MPGNQRMRKVLATSLNRKKIHGLLRPQTTGEYEHKIKNRRRTRRSNDLKKTTYHSMIL